ncbi:hypothetical protein BO70DRAFT_395741 [Aspergillus heteromorphus CBS 117.55]|uniref:Uncharacterized protein n=1 Tax=Aspergillus heteromorphus CBS 117.55 TaxID=1448321 RepID=A0A317WLH0_9EURO|nr:uncharacterized protein BO70DRAFT_395741 [Aspergillus heteromorphus CBS 117.55]PWY85070.1 hypothetical protein BO70DRAFT_395741 [Aspergillus heteromorphus CBS 117.55]
MVRPNLIKVQVAHVDIIEELMDDTLAFLFGHSVHNLKKQRAGIRDNIEQDFASALFYAHKLIQRVCAWVRELRNEERVIATGYYCFTLEQYFLHVGNEPRIWKKLREDVAVLKGRAPSYEQLRNLM